MLKTNMLTLFYTHALRYTTNPTVLKNLCFSIYEPMSYWMAMPNTDHISENCKILCTFGIKTKGNELIPIS